MKPNELKLNQKFTLNAEYWTRRRKQKKKEEEETDRINTSSHLVVSYNLKLNLFVGTKTETQITSDSKCVCATSIYLAQSLQTKKNGMKKKNKSFEHERNENGLHNVFVAYF